MKGFNGQDKPPPIDRRCAPATSPPGEDEEAGQGIPPSTFAGAQATSPQGEDGEAGRGQGKGRGQGIPPSTLAGAQATSPQGEDGEAGRGQGKGRGQGIPPSTFAGAQATSPQGEDEPRRFCFMRRARGFTLIEVLLALAILASAFTVLMVTVAHSGEQSVYSTKLTQASLLARSQMVELEYMIKDEGFSEARRTHNGDFRREGYPDIRWEAEIEPVEIPPDAEERFMAQVNQQLFGGMESDGGALGGNPAFSAMLPMLMGQMPHFVNQLGQRVRRVILRVYFNYRGGEQSLEVTQYVVDEEAEDFEMFGMPDHFDGSDFEIGDEDFDSGDLELDFEGR